MNPKWIIAIFRADHWMMFRGLCRRDLVGEWMAEFFLAKIPLIPLIKATIAIIY